MQFAFLIDIKSNRLRARVRFLFLGMADSSDYSQNEKIAICGAGITVLGAFLPWIELGDPASQNGIDGDGVFTLGFALLVAGIVVVRNWRKVDKGAVVVLGLLTLGIGVLYISDPSAGVDMEGTGAFGQALADAMEPGLGLYVTTLGGLGMTVGGVLGIQNE